MLTLDKHCLKKFNYPRLRYQAEHISITQLTEDFSSLRIFLRLNKLTISFALIVYNR